MTPRRIQRKRTKGWRMPGGAVYVGRPTCWGNPWSVSATEPGWWWVHGPFEITFMPLESESAAMALVVDTFRDYVSAGGFRGLRPTWLYDDAIDELADRDLACWCPLEDEHGNRVPCHADVLLELANPGWRP